MMYYRQQVEVATQGQGTYEITQRVEQELERSSLEQGLAHVFCLHTSCSLVLMENADPSARRDLEDWMRRLVRENDPHFTHTFEGPDDMPSHIKMALTRSSETLPVANGRLVVGTWQGLFLWEHRDRPNTRQLVLTFFGPA